MTDFTLGEILDAIQHTRSVHQHAAEGRILETPMPNGKQLGECTCTEIGEFGARLTAIQVEIERRRAA